MIYKTVRRMLAEIMGMDESVISPDMRLWRSMDVIGLSKLLIACERQFNITIHDEHASCFRLVRDLNRYVEARVSEGPNDRGLSSDRAREAWYYE